MNSATCGGRIWDSTHLLSFSISSCCLLSLMLSDWCLNAGRVGRRRSTPHPNASGNPGSLRTTFTALSIRPSPNDLDCQLVKLDVASSFPRITATAAGCKALWSATAKARRGSSRSFFAPRCGTTRPSANCSRCRETGSLSPRGRRTTRGFLDIVVGIKAAIERIPSAHQPTPMMVVGATGAEPAWAAEPVNAPRAGAEAET